MAGTTESRKKERKVACLEESEAVLKGKGKMAIPALRALAASCAAGSLRLLAASKGCHVSARAIANALQPCKTAKRTVSMPSSWLLLASAFSLGVSHAFVPPISGHKTLREQNMFPTQVLFLRAVRRHPALQPSSLSFSPSATASASAAAADAAVACMDLRCSHCS